MKNSLQLTPFLTFEREQWSALRKSVPLKITEQELAPLIGFNESISLSEVSDIYLPLIRLIHYYIDEDLQRRGVLNRFLGRSKSPHKIPYIIGIAGSVAVGKSTTARILQNLLSSYPHTKKVDLVTTDGFLYPLTTLQKKNLMYKKGFPVSYDILKLLRFLADVKSGGQRVEAPVYSHLTYDITEEVQVVEQPDILILEGLNVLQPSLSPHKVCVSDFLDFSIYVDAEESLLKNWYVKRFLSFCQNAFNDPNSYFKEYSKLSPQEATGIANKIWTEINGLNLRENILPTRERANLILTKGQNHRVERIKLRK